MIRHATTGSPEVVYILSFVPLIQGGTRKHTVYDDHHTTYALHAFLAPLTFSPVAKTRSRCAAAGTAANLFGSSGVVFYFCPGRSLHRRTRLRILIELRRTDRPNTAHNNVRKMRYSVSCAAICIAGVPMACAFVPASLLQPLLQATRSYAARSLRTQATAMTKQSDDESSSTSTSSDQDGSKTYRVVFLRHGESTWNRDDRHIGWTGEVYRYVGARNSDER